MYITIYWRGHNIQCYCYAIHIKYLPNCSAKMKEYIQNMIIMIEVLNQASIELCIAVYISVTIATRYTSSKLYHKCF